ncbi:MAG: O-antigen ligase family protein [Gallionellaceae bacterium]|nr:O-antigen ligase family protein [Gallionellaceae bacterium]
MIIARLFSFFRLLSRWSVITLGVAIPLSTALDNILLGLLLMLVLVSNSRDVWLTLKHNSVARACILLFAALLVGTAYGHASLKEAVGTLSKYADLALVPLLMVAMRTTETRQRIMLGFLTTMLITAVLSWLVGLHILPVTQWMWRGCSPENPAIFRSSITQSILMAYAAYILALQARDALLPRTRWLLAGLAVVAGSDVLFMVQGRTGYLVMLALLIYFIWTTAAQRFNRQGRNIGWRTGAGISILSLVLVMSTYLISPRLHQQMDKIVTEFQAWQPNTANETSTGERLEFYYNTQAIIKQHPMLGVGTGGFYAAYAQQIEGKGLIPTRNPHNEYLLITAQLGLAGLALMFYLFYTQWQQAAKLAGPFQQNAARGLLLSVALASLFNSPLLDHTEGLFFAFMSALWFVDLGTDKKYA